MRRKIMKSIHWATLAGLLILSACTTPKPATIRYDSGWYIYRNEKYGYEIRYPDGFDAWATGLETERDGASIRIGLKEFEAPAPILDIQVHPRASMQETRPTPQEMITNITDVEINGVPGTQSDYYWKANGELFMVEVYLEGVLFRFHPGAGLHDFHATRWWEIISTFRFLNAEAM
jgi:hypothetical protein